MPNFDHDPRQTESVFDHLCLHSLAMDLADHAARSDIELYSTHVLDAAGRRVFDTKIPRDDFIDEESAALVGKALRYIELRGSALPYRLRRSGSVVWFEALESAN